MVVSTSYQVRINEDGEASAKVMFTVNSKPEVKQLLKKLWTVNASYNITIAEVVKSINMETGKFSQTVTVITEDF